MGAKDRRKQRIDFAAGMDHFLIPDPISKLATCFEGLYSGAA
jgi:hypothetical protein